MQIGLIGSENLKKLILKEFSSDKYFFCDLEPNKTFNNFFINRLYKILYFLKKINQVDLLYCIFIRKNTWVYAKVAKILKKKVIYHWAGTDLYNIQLGKDKIEHHKKVADLHCAYANNLHDELKELGVESYIFPIVPIDIDCSHSGMPLHHAVLISIPDNLEERAHFYGYSETIELIKAFPMIPFYITRSSHPEKYEFANVVFKGQISSSEMNKLYDEISIIVRLPKHDGQSLLLMEGTIKGKYMIYNHIMPYTIHVNNVREAKDAIKKIIKESPQVQEKEREYGLRHYNIDVCKKKFDHVISLLF